MRWGYGQIPQPTLPYLYISTLPRILGCGKVGFNSFTDPLPKAPICEMGKALAPTSTDYQIHTSTFLVCTLVRRVRDPPIKNSRRGPARQPVWLQSITYNPRQGRAPTRRHPPGARLRDYAGTKGLIAGHDRPIASQSRRRPRYPVSAIFHSLRRPARWRRPYVVSRARRLVKSLDS